METAEVDAGETGIAKPQKENSDDKQTGHT
jgi:hypothetical protein